MAKIATVIVNYKTPKLVVQCLASLKDAALKHDLSVFIGDAASGDESVEVINDFIARERLDWAHCFGIGRNGGFAYGNNAVLSRYVLSDSEISHVYFLNPDTYIYPGAVDALVSFLQSRPEVGIVGSRLENPDGSLRAYAFRAPQPWREFFRAVRLSSLSRIFPQTTLTIEELREDRQVDWVTGASFMVRRDVLDDIGLMDDGYFLYFEETDLMTRARAAGYDVWHVSESRVVHLAGQSTGVRTGDSKLGLKPLSPHWLASRRRYMRKHFGPLGPHFANAFFLLGDVIYRLHRLLRAQPIENPPNLWRSYLEAKSE